MPTLDPQTTYGTDSITYSAVSQSTFRIRTDCTGLRFIIWGNWPVGSYEGSESPLPNPIEVAYWIKIAGTDAILPITLNGRQVFLVQPGGSYTTDPLNYTFHSGDQIILFSFQNRAASIGIRYADGSQGQLATTQPLLFRSTVNQGADTIPGGVLSASTNPTALPLNMTNIYVSAFGLSYNFLPSYAIGSVAIESNRCVAIVGDSISGGSTDGFNYASPPSGGGYWARALATNLPLMQLSLPADRLAYWTWPNLKYVGLRPGMLHYNPRYVVCCMGVSDIFYGDDFPTITNRMMRLWQRVSQETGAKLFQTTITPKNHSVSGKYFGPGDLYYLSAADEAVRVMVNNWLRSTPAPPPLAGVIDVASIVETSTNSGYWKYWTNNFDSGTTTRLNTNLTSTLSRSYALVDDTKSWLTNQWVNFPLQITNIVGGNNWGGELLCKRVYCQ